MLLVVKQALGGKFLLPAFCREQFFRHKLALDRSSMMRRRGGIGVYKLELLLAEALAVAVRTQAVSERALDTCRWIRPSKLRRSCIRPTVIC